MPDYSHPIIERAKEVTFYASSRYELRALAKAMRNAADWLYDIEENIEKRDPRGCDVILYTVGIVHDNFMGDDDTMRYGIHLSLYFSDDCGQIPVNSVLQKETPTQS